MSAPQPAPTKYPMTPLGVRVRKPMDYVRHYTNIPRAILESGDLILVEPRREWGYYIVRLDSMPELLPSKTQNIADRWDTSIPVLTHTASPSPIEAELDTLNMGRMELAHYRLVVLDPGVQVQILQPAATKRFDDKSGARRLSYGNTAWHYLRGEYGLLPEVWCFQDNTPITASATSTNMDAASYWARILAIGYKYHLQRVRPPEPENEPRTVLTIRIGERQ